MSKYYNVVIKSQKTKYKLIEQMSYKEALRFCEEYNWEFKDGSEFVWDLDIEEDYQ